VGRDHSAAQEAARPSVRPAGVVLAQREGNPARDPWARERAAVIVPAGLAGLAVITGCRTSQIRQVTTKIGHLVREFG
jgi:metal-dependent hydrolase (beta-lactamase superfamily II)